MSQCEQQLSGASSVDAVLAASNAVKTRLVLRKLLETALMEQLKAGPLSQQASSATFNSTTAPVYEDILWKKIFYEPLATAKKIKKVIRNNAL